MLRSRGLRRTAVQRFLSTAKGYSASLALRIFKFLRHLLSTSTFVIPLSRILMEQVRAVLSFVLERVGKQNKPAGSRNNTKDKSDPTSTNAWTAASCVETGQPSLGCFLQRSWPGTEAPEGQAKPPPIRRQHVSGQRSRNHHGMGSGNASTGSSRVGSTSSSVTVQDVSVRAEFF